MRELHGALVWLGQGEDSTILAACQSICMLCVQCLKVAGNYQGALDSIFYDDQNKSTPASSDELLDCDWYALAAFYSRPWFTRLWIMQELMRGPIPVIHCGRHTINDLYSVELVTQWLCYRKHYRHQYVGRRLAGIECAAARWRHRAR